MFLQLFYTILQHWLVEKVFAVNCSSIFTPFLHTSLEVAQWNCCINWFCLKNIHDLTKDENCNCWFYRSISRVVILMSFRFLQLVVAHPAFSKVEDLKKFLKEEKVSISNNPCKCGWFSPKICKVTYYGETTLDFNSIASVFSFIKSTITVFIFRGHKCFKDKISWHNIHWATSKELCRNGVKIELQFIATISSSTSQCCRMV